MSEQAVVRVIEELQRIGVSANRGLLTFRGAGGRIRRERWLELWRDREAAARLQRVLAGSGSGDAA